MRISEAPFEEIAAVPVDTVSMARLWREAAQFGSVNLYTLDSGQVFCGIKFATARTIRLEAKSSFDCTTPEQALLEAIHSARAISGTAVTL